MLGDGINDSTALATATVGAAMGETSAALAANSADVVLMTDKLQRLTQCIRLCRYAFCIERLNIFLPCLVKVIEIGFALSGHLQLWMAIVADLGTLMLVLVLGLSVLSRRFWTEKDSQEYSDSWPILNLVITDEMIDIELKTIEIPCSSIMFNLSWSIWPPCPDAGVLLYFLFPTSKLFCQGNREWDR